MTHLEAIQSIADALLNPPGTAEASAEMQRYLSSMQSATVSLNAGSGPEFGTPKSIAVALREKLFARIDVLDGFVKRSKNAGLVVPENPIAVLMQANSINGAQRKLFAPIGVTETRAQELLASLKKLTAFIDDETAGRLQLVKQSVSSFAQISSYAVGVEGLGNYSVNDLNGFVPTADAAKLKKTIEALTSLDFSKRIPRVLFTADFSADGIVSNGAIIGWRRMFDAAGYIIDRHDVFRNVDRSFSFSNAQLLEKQKFISDYIRDWVLSFYDVDEKSVVAWVDDQVEQDSYYVYRISAYQNSAPAQGTIFFVDTAVATLSAEKLREIKNEMTALVTVKAASLQPSNPAFQMSSQTGLAVVDARPAGNIGSLGTRPTVQPTSTRPTQTVGSIPLSFSFDEVSEDPTMVPFGLSVDSISPYPYIAKKLYGDAQYDWLLAGSNVKASFERRDSVEKLRSFSYLGSSLSFISAQIALGNFVMPTDIQKLIENVETSVSSFGVARTLTEILDATGMLFFFNSKDIVPGQPAATDATESGALAAILSTIDIETATLDPKKLLSNIRAQTNSLSSALQFAPSPVVDIEVRLRTDHTSDTLFADQAAQFVGDVNSDTSLIDLTTFAGISRFIRTLRTFFDFNTGRR